MRYQTVQFQSRRLAVTLAVLAGSVAPSVAAPPSFGWPSFRDIKVTVQARGALSNDPVLADLNLSVQVRNGVATVWGPIPDDHLSSRATRALEKVKGVYEVRNQTYVAAPLKGEDALLAPFVQEQSVKSEAASVGSLTGRVEPEPEIPSRPGLQTTVSLQPPVIVVEAKPTSASAPASPVAKAIEQLRLSEARFRPIATELQGNLVLVHGGSARGEHVMAFAQAISQLPGVERVIVKNGPDKPR